jgi:hypothetical protein
VSINPLKPHPIRGGILSITSRESTMRSWLLACVLPFTLGTATAAPTFTQDVAPILFASCVNCHREGEIGPFSLMKYEDAKKRAKQIARVVDEKTMPPWKPDPGHGDFRDERKLTKKQIDTLKEWAEAGAPEGNAKLLPKPPVFKDGWKLGKPDIILKMEKPFTIPATGRDVYQHFVFPMNLDKDVYLIGVECRPGNRKVAHHAVGILDTSGTARKLEAKQKDKGPGYPGNGPGFIPAGFTPGYVPGQTPRFMTEGQAITIKKGTDFVLQMHYHPTGKEETDQTEIGLFLSKKPPTQHMVVVAMASEEIDIPAGKKDYKAADEFKLPVDFELQSVWSHMHIIGKTNVVWAETPNGKKIDLLKISDWDFNWQDTYEYKKSIKLPKGTIIKSEWTWDNSADNPRQINTPPKRIRLGEGSADEMSGLILGGTVSNGLDAGIHWATVIGHYLEVAGKGLKYK